MNLGQLRQSFRRRAGDKNLPHEWEDREVDSLINLAYYEACDRGNLIFDRESFVIVTEANRAEYQLDRVITRIKRVWLVGETVDSVKADDQPLFELTSDDVLDWTRWHRFGSDIRYQAVTFGQLRYGVTEDHAFILAPTPTEVRTLRLEVWRLPTDILANEESEPEITLPIYHDKMLSWALHLAYADQDSETRDGKRSQDFAAEFERDFGPPKNAIQRRAHLENRVLRTFPSPI